MFLHEKITHCHKTKKININIYYSVIKFFVYIYGGKT